MGVGKARLQTSTVTIRGESTILKRASGTMDNSFPSIFIGHAVYCFHTKMSQIICPDSIFGNKTVCALNTNNSISYYFNYVAISVDSNDCRLVN